MIRKRTPTTPAYREPLLSGGHYIYQGDSYAYTVDGLYFTDEWHPEPYASPEYPLAVNAGAGLPPVMVTTDGVEIDALGVALPRRDQDDIGHELWPMRAHALSEASRAMTYAQRMRYVF